MKPNSCACYGSNDIHECYCNLKNNNMKQETLELPVEINFANEIEQISEYDKGRWYGRIEGAKWQADRMYSEEDMISFAEFVASYPDKNKNVYGQMLHAKSKYDGAERTIDLLQVWCR